MINEHESKEVIMLAFRAIKFGEAEFLKAVQAYLKYRQNAPPQHGKVKLKELMQMDQGATMMEIRPEGVRGFQRIAKKYNVDFSITKDRTQNPPAYQVFFKGRDQEVMAKAFNEYVNKQQKKAECFLQAPFQSFWTIERTKYLLEVINRILGIVGDYTWANSQMDVTQEELFMDTVKIAQYRLVRKPKNEYRHHMWDKYGLKLYHNT